MRLNIKRKLGIATVAGCLVAISCGTALGQGNSAFGRGQKGNPMKGFGNSSFGRATAASHAGNHGNSAFGRGQFHNPMKGSGNSAFGRAKAASHH
jgi:hypothetical protein